MECLPEELILKIVFSNRILTLMTLKCVNKYFNKLIDDAMNRYALVKYGLTSYDDLMEVALYEKYYLEYIKSRIL